MVETLLTRATKTSLTVTLLTEKEFPAWLKRQQSRIGNWVRSQSFEASPGTYLLIPDAKGKPSSVVAGLSSPPSLWDLAALPKSLPAGTYALAWKGPLAFQEWLALGWELGAYRFGRYKKKKGSLAKLVLPAGADFEKIRRYAEAIQHARDLINTPAQDMGPEELAAAIVETGRRYGAKVSQIKGQDLLKKNYPAIHAVGRASVRAPRLVDLVWGKPKHPRVTLVGKGVCFDTGGLDLKSSSGMYLMKKDMGGAASALAVAQMVMDAKLPVRLRLLVPAVENAVSGNAYRPSDVLTMRNGMTVEVGNTDAEGRLVLADALVEADSEDPEMIIDFSTLTGAARTALGTDIAALFSNNDALAEEMLDQSRQMEDPSWRMPLYAPYKKMLETQIADCNSAPSSPYAGAITAALFLQQFVAPTRLWAHLDFAAWNISGKPGRPEGAEAMAVRMVYRVIEERFGKRR